jgi:hypothetical protein
LQHARPPRLVQPFAAAAVLALALAFAPPGGLMRAGAQQPPGAAQPTAAPGELPPAVTPAPDEATPEASETPGNAFLKKPGQKREPKAKPSQGPQVTPTPTSPAFATLDGTWEVQVQHPDTTDYSYLIIKQAADGVLTGNWRIGKTLYPLDGTYDGRLIKLVVKEPSGDVTLSGYVETASDMVGLVDYGAGKGTPVAFTAEHRSRPKGLGAIQ